MSSKEAVNTNYFSLSLTRRGYRTQVYRLRGGHSRPRTG